MFLTLIATLLTWGLSTAAPNYLIGAGIADMTGPAADVNLVSLQHHDTAIARP